MAEQPDHDLPESAGEIPEERHEAHVYSHMQEVVATNLDRIFRNGAHGIRFPRNGEPLIVWTETAGIRKRICRLCAELGIEKRWLRVERPPGREE